MGLPPGVLSQQLAQAFPQFILCDAGLSAALAGYLDPSSNPDASNFVQWLQDNSAVAAAAGDVLNPPGDPQAGAAPLDASLVAALAPLLASTSSWIVAQPSFAGVAWTVQGGVSPGPVAPQPATGAWTFAGQSPIGGLEFPQIAYSGPRAGAFTLTLVNNLPRHLSVYATFLSGGAPLAPANWKSLLPKGAPSGFESDTVKYLDMLRPNAAVGAIAVDSAAQTLTFAQPANADAVRLVFGGLNRSEFDAVPDAAGILMTFVLDIFVPWVVAYSAANKANLSKWLAGLLADRSLVGQVLASGAFLLGLRSIDAMFSALSTKLTGAILGKPLAGLRDRIAGELGAPPGETYSWVDQLAPAAGWAAQMIQAYLENGLNPQYWAATMPSAITLPLSPATTLSLDLALNPDPASGIWPYRASSYTADIAYGRGFSQTLSGKIPPAQSSAPISVQFGSVANVGPITIAAAVLDASGAVVAQAQGGIAPSINAPSRDLAATVAVSDVAVRLGPSTRYARVARLTFADGAYAWDTRSTASTSTGLAPGASGAPAVAALIGLTLQGDELCLGYAWGVSGQPATVCGGSAPLPNPHFIQNVGTAAPAAQLKTIACGLVVAPQLVYSPIAGEQGAPDSGGYYVDTQGDGVFLRATTFSPGSFDLQSSLSVAQFPAQSGRLGMGLHPAGYAAIVNADRNILQVAPLAPQPAPDAEAPMALVFGGGGDRIGLLSSPVAVAAMPNGAFVVLEQGNARVQAFDVGGNPVAMFEGQAAFALRSVPLPAYADLAVTADGAICVLGSQNGGAVASDFFLDVYNPDGTLLNTTTGVNAAKIAINAGSTLYTLDFDTLAGQGGRIEPALSVWRPNNAQSRS